MLTDSNREIVLALGRILVDFQFDSRGLCKSRGPLDRCDFPTVYFWFRKDRHELITYPSGAKSWLILPSEIERKILGLKAPYWELFENPQTQVFGREITPAQAEGLRLAAKYAHMRHAGQRTDSLPAFEGAS